jgi:hypothetical protein
MSVIVVSSIRHSGLGPESGSAIGTADKKQKRINRRWTPMDADEPNGIFVFGFLQAAGVGAMGTITTNPLLIGVHRRPSAVQMLFP